MSFPALYQDDEIRAEKRHALGLIILNRPQTLNALSLEMIRIIGMALKNWEKDNEVKAVAIVGAGDRAFCAGGDIKAAYYAGMDVRRGQTDERVPVVFFAEEYMLNRAMHHYKKPVIALMNGIVMGGGYGLAAQCRFRVACEKSLFAMPEVGIGFFPDVGSAWHLARMPYRAGLCLGITGMAVGPSDMKFTGVATHYMPGGRFASLVGMLDDALGRQTSPANAIVAIEKVLESCSDPMDDLGDLEINAPMIERIFASRDVETILAALRADDSDYARELAQMMERRSPLSMKVAALHIQQAARAEFDDVIERDFILARRFLRGHDFYEGIKSTLITRDKSPGWIPESLKAAAPDIVESYFDYSGKSLDEMAA